MAHGNTKPLDERFARLHEKTERGCWEWTGAASSNRAGWKYGRVKIAGKLLMAHRFSYEFHGGSLEQDEVVDHVCNNTLCVNPTHLRAVSQKQNLHRSLISCAAVNAAKESCPKGHDYDEANTYIREGKRHCRACHRDRERIRQANRRRLFQQT